MIEESQKSLNVRNGPVLSADLFDNDENGQQILALAAHHLVIDIVSWTIVLQDLEDLLMLGKCSIPPSLSFQTWSELQDEHANKELSKAVRYEVNVPVANYSYWGMVDQPNLYGDIIAGEFELDQDVTQQILGPCHSALDSKPLDLFIGAILHSFRQSFEDRGTIPAVFNETHGRHPWIQSLDVSHTIGWFTSLCPVFLTPESAQQDDIVTTVRWVKDLRSRIKDNGRQHFAYRTLTEEGRQQFSGHWPMEIMFNYSGQEKHFTQTDSLFRPVDGISGTSDLGKDTPRPALFEISASVSEDKLKFSVWYNRHVQRQDGVHRWIAALESCLRRGSEHLLKMEPEATMSNFPLISLTYNGLSVLHERLQSIGVSSLAAIEDVYGCSPTQQGLILAQLRADGNYLTQCIFSVRTSDPDIPADARRLAQAWHRVVQRHASLRAIFVESISEDNLMDQVILKSYSPRVNWLRCDENDAVATLRQQQPLSLAEKVPQHRLTICNVSTRVFCKLEINHALCDGTSLQIILNELALFYQSPASDHLEKPLYSNYISYLKQQSRDDDNGYWEQYLQDLDSCSFPALTDGIQRIRELQRLKLEPVNNLELQQYCSRHAVTASTVLQLAWSIVLGTYTGSDTVCFGYLSAGRDHPVSGIHEAVGLFISMLVRRMEMQPDLQVQKALRQIQADTAEGMTHQGYSLSDVQHELNLTGRSLFNTAFNFQRDVGSLEPNDEDLVCEFHEVHDPSEYAISVNVDAEHSRTVIELVYWSDFLSRRQAINIGQTFEQVLGSIIGSRDNDQTLGAISLCNDAMRGQMLKWNQIQLPKLDQCVHDIIARQSHIVPPSTPAICSWDFDLSYEELCALAKRLAKFLIGVGVGAEIYVPIAFEKSTWAVVAMLGVLQAGGAFVPLDPSTPESRISSILQDTQAKIVLCSERHVDKFNNFRGVNAFVVKKMLEPRHTATPTQASSTATPYNAAYLIFTSGTTGRPKGTIISHYAIATSAQEHGSAVLLDEKSRSLQFASLCFDASITEILTTLMRGGCVCIPSDDERMEDIAGAINRMAVNWTLLTPSVASILRPETVPSLKVLVSGGEKMQASHIAKWSGKASLINAYGPSESAVIATTSTKVSEYGYIEDQDPSNIGHPVGSRCWIVDRHDHNKLMPIGAIGELVVAGNTVARGYLNDKAKTEKSFVNLPSWMPQADHEYAEGHPKKMYKTGDLVRYSSSGNIIYISRKDTQVKLNGLRIELGDIEHHVKANLPSRDQGIVEIVTPLGQKKALVAFLACLEDESDVILDHVAPTTISRSEPLGAKASLLPISGKALLLARKIKSSLTATLPSYMVPSLFIPISRMPWTTSGKVDRRYLQSLVSNLPWKDTAQYRLTETMSSGPTNDTASVTETTNKVESKLQKLWEEILELEPGSVSIESDFLALGGDSVQSMKLVAAARAQNISLTVLDVFRKPKFLDMASACRFLKEEEAPAALKPFSMLPDNEVVDQLLDEVAQQCQVDKENVADIYPCTTLQQALLAVSAQQPGAYVAHDPFRLPADISISRFQRCWEKAVEDLEVLRTRVYHSNLSNFLQVVLRKESIEWHSTENWRDVSSDTVQLPEQMGLPLLRFTIIDKGSSNDRYFVLSIHHVLYDGYSLAKILERVEASYYEEPITFLNAQYAPFVKYNLDIDGEASKRFWRSRLEGLRSTQYPRVPSCGINKDITISTSNHDGPVSKIPSLTGITLPTIIRAAWAILLSYYTGCEDVVYGESLMGRDVPVDNMLAMLGPTLATVPSRTLVKPNSTVREFLQQLHEMATDLIPHQHFGLQNIRKLGKEAESACDFQNLLVIQTGIFKDEPRLWNVVRETMPPKFFTYPLVLEIWATGSIKLYAHYDSQVISAMQVERLMNQFNFILTQLLAIPNGSSLKVGEVQAATKQDVDKIRKWNSHEPRAVNKTVHDLFFQQVKRQPASEAVSAWDGAFNYHELKRHAERLSKFLLRLGISPGDNIPVCMDKSRWSVVAQLGVLIANGALVPLDPAHTVDWHRDVIAGVNADILICSPRYKHKFSDLVENVVVVDDRLFASNKLVRLDDIFTTQSRASDTAYIIHTSDASGRPKGVMVDHAAFCTGSVGFCKAQSMKSTSRVFNFAPSTADVCFMEVLSPLLTGACVCIPNSETNISNTSMAINNLAATWAFLTPAMAKEVDPSAVPSLEVLVCGGETMSADIVQRWSDKVQLVSSYGQPEASIISIVNSTVSPSKEPSNIGYAHENVRAWIVDSKSHNRLAPIGCEGELLLEGPLLASGYLHDETKTAAAFIENPQWISQFSNASGLSQRLFKTGDIVRYEADGSMVYIGRKDSQVNLHGQRIDLRDIEHRLSACMHVRHAVVLLPKDGLFKDRLVATVTLLGISPGKAALKCDQCILLQAESRSAQVHLRQARDSLTDQLPSFMNPTVWVALEAIPLLLSGKINRKAIEEWIKNIDEANYNHIITTQDGASQDGASENGGSNGIVQKLQGLWAEALNIPTDEVDPNRSFMGQGGDSLIAMSLIASCRKAGFSLSLREILQSRSLYHISSLVESRVTSASNGEARQTDEETDEPFELLPIQRLYFQTSECYTGPSRFNQSQLLRINRQINIASLTDVLRVIVQEHSMFRARFIKGEKGRWQQKIVNEINKSYRFRTSQIETSSGISSLLADSQSSLDIEHGPMLAVDLFNIGSNEQVLSFVAHHLVVDVVSWQIVLRDLHDLLSKAIRTTQKPFPYQTWCKIQNDGVSGESSTQARDAISLDAENTDSDFWGMTGRPNVYGNAKQNGFVLEKSLTQLALGRANHPFNTQALDIFISALIYSFSRIFANRTVPTVFNETHGRNSPSLLIDLTRTTGWFTSINPFQLAIDPDNDGPIDVLKKTKDFRCAFFDSHETSTHHSTNSNGRLHTSRPTPMEILFNYTGRNVRMEKEGIFSPAIDVLENEKLPADVGPKAARMALFEVVASHYDDKLEFSFLYNNRMQHQDLIEQWISECQRTLIFLVESLVKSSAEPTLADFPLLPTDYAGLRKHVNKTLREIEIINLESVEDMSICTPIQEGMLLSQLRNPSQYLSWIILEVQVSDEGVNVERLVGAWQQVVNRHQSLRTAFVSSVCRGHAFDQIVLKQANGSAIHVQCADSGLSDQLKKVSLREINRKRRPNLPHQFTICTTSSGRCYIKLEINHAVIDARSLALITRDLELAYKNRPQPGQKPLYSEYIKFIKNNPEAEHLAFWREYLSGVQSCHLPTSQGLIEGAKRLGSAQVAFDRFLELQEFCRMNELTLPNVMLVAWGLVLRQYTGSDDVCFGNLTSGRDAPVDDIQDTVGAFINMLACRIKYNPSDTLKSIFHKVHDGQLGSLQHQYCSLTRVQHDLGFSSEPLFNTAVSIHNEGSTSNEEIQHSSFRLLPVENYDPTEVSFFRFTFLAS